MFQERGQFQERQREQDQVQPFSNYLVMKNHIFPLPLSKSNIFTKYNTMHCQNHKVRIHSHIIYDPFF